MSQRLCPRSRLSATLVALALTLAACADEPDAGDKYLSWTGAGDDGNGDGDDDGAPRGAQACAERYFSKLSAECATTDCGEALTCEIDWDCLTCADRCEAHSCGSDADCVEAYGQLCADVEWRCEPYITSSNLRCAVYDIGVARCGDDQCASEESCESCSEDCGYCPGTAPAMAPCTADGDCASGVCGGWCVADCSSGWDCVGDGNGVLYGDCLVTGDGSSYCFPSCTVEGGCASYPGTSCVSAESVDGGDVQVCSG